MNSKSNQPPPPIISDELRLRAEVAALHAQHAEMKADIEIVMHAIERIEKVCNDTLHAYRAKHVPEPVPKSEQRPNHD